MMLLSLQNLLECRGDALKLPDPQQWHDMLGASVLSLQTYESSASTTAAQALRLEFTNAPGRGGLYLQPTWRTGVGGAIEWRADSTQLILPPDEDGGARQTYCVWSDLAFRFVRFDMSGFGKVPPGETMYVHAYAR